MKLLNSVRKYGALPVASGLVSVGLAVPAFAAEVTPASPTNWSAVISVPSWRHSARAVCPSSPLGSGLPWLGPLFERKVYGN